MYLYIQEETESITRENAVVGSVIFCKMKKSIDKREAREYSKKHPKSYNIKSYSTNLYYTKRDNGGVTMGKKEETPKTLKDFREATMELDNIYSMFPKSCGLSEAEYWSLLLIYEGVVTQSQISERLFLSRQTLNSAFKQLRKKGLVILEPYEENQRSKQAFLTDAGKAYVEEYVLQMHRIEENAWKQMSEEEQMLLTETTRKFSDLIRKELEVSKANMMRSSSEGLRPQP